MPSVHEIYPPDAIVVRDVSLRDGLQLVKTYPDTAAKERWLGIEYDAGLRHFEVGSYLSTAAAPQFADVGAVIAAAHRRPGAVRAPSRRC